MSESVSSKKRKANDGSASSVVKTDPPPCQPCSSSNSQPAKVGTRTTTHIPISDNFREGEAKTRSQSRGCMLAALADAPAHESLFECGDTLGLLNRQCGDLDHHHHADFGYFIDYSRVDPILKLLRDLPKARHPVFDTAIHSLEKALKAWPKTHIPAQRVISPLRTLFKHFGAHILVVEKVAEGMDKLPQLRWWAESEYHINETLPNALQSLAGLAASGCHVPEDKVCNIMDVLLKMAEKPDFGLPPAMLTALRYRTSPPNLLQDCPLVFDLKLEAIRVQVSNVLEKYQLVPGYLKSLFEQQRTLEAEVRRHESNVKEA